ncbi:MAG: hypothetical protein LBL24_11860 [Bacteroidales bacterium]|nr:hypothetical protein [Bacteroidales bacterium]
MDSAIHFPDSIQCLISYHFLSLHEVIPDRPARTLEPRHKRFWPRHKFDKNAKDTYMNIPWYLLVDENGRIIKEHAETPSEIVREPEIPWG